MSQPPVAQNPPRPGGGRGRLTTAAAVALAVTAGPLALMSPAVAAPVTAAESPQTAVVAATANAAATASGQSRRNENLPKIPKHSRVLSAGKTGYLVHSEYDRTTQKYTASWVRTADGSVTQVAAYPHTSQGLRYAGAVGDVLVLPGDATERKVTLTDLSAGAPGTKTVIDLPAGYKYLGAVGGTVVVNAGNSIRLLTKSGETVTDREVTGLPPMARSIVGVVGSGPGTVVVRLETDHLAVIDTNTANSTGLHAIGTGRFPSVAVTATPEHLAWIESPEKGHGSTSNLIVVDRATGAEIRRSVIPFAWRPLIGVTGGQVVYGTEYLDYDLTGRPAELAINTTPLTGGTPVKLLDRAFAMHPAADGSVLVTGGTLDRDEGVYRVTAPSGTATAEKIATTGDTTRITFLKSNVPAEANLDTKNLVASWELSRHDAAYTLTLEQPATGTTYTTPVRRGDGDGYPPRFDWDGRIGDGNTKRYAPSGPYTWTLKAVPRDGIGPAATATGTIDVKRTRAPHDWTNNGSPDLLVTDGAGRLWREDSYYQPFVPAEDEHSRPIPEELAGSGRKQVGSGFGKYDRIESVGVQQGRTAFLARDAAGDVWLHHDNGSGTPLAQGVKVGWGWQTYTRIAGGGQHGDGSSPDVLAVDTKGDLYFHAGTNTQPTAFTPRKKVGWGWGIYNEVTSVGDIAGSEYGDLVARDKDGVLWLYQGRWDGSFELRVRIGGGWNEYNQLVGIGDANRDGKADLYAYGPGGRAYFYAGTGQAATPFKPRVASTVLAANSSEYEIIF
ncbi:hypothetical protein ABZ714_29415 [Streptomyces sp. NPDC006798]|uniref:hypothetical protein n=1 Tax=Streptomyces sp. NPDC006798 TaxID=3155462 RepID=UPI0033EA4EC2